MDKLIDIAIIGAGPSGMMAAITARRNGGHPVLIEANDRVGKKILSTGNGKCNLSHYDIDETFYHGSGKEHINALLNNFNTADTIQFFKSIGMLCRDRDGYIYPYSEQASTVLDVLRFSIADYEIPVILNSRIQNISYKDNSYVLTRVGQGELRARKVILATGGYAAPKTGSDGVGLSIANSLGINVTKCVPALVKLKSSSSLCKSLDGVRAKGNICLVSDCAKEADKIYGEIQFTKDGLSGIPIFNISRSVGYLLSNHKPVSIRVDLFPDITKEELCELICNKQNTYIKPVNADILLTGLVNKKLVYAVLKQCKINPESTKKITKQDILALASTFKNLTFEIIDIYGYEQAQVTAGGIDFTEINDNLMSHKYAGLYFAGEICDIDGECGGYNLQWAWTSGYIAGKAAAES